MGRNFSCCHNSDYRGTIEEGSFTWGYIKLRWFDSNCHEVEKCLNEDELHLLIKWEK